SLPRYARRCPPAQAVSPPGVHRYNAITAAARVLRILGILTSHSLSKSPGFRSVDDLHDDTPLAQHQLSGPIGWRHETSDETSDEPAPVHRTAADRRVRAALISQVGPARVDVAFE
ncbi:MAG: hypothetical protein ACJ74U_04930, partial [Jatrophihabitantaceae bacterium]